PNQKIKRMPIVIKDAQYPINISWDINPENALTYSVSFMPEGGLGKPQIYNVETSGNLVIPKIKNGIISLTTSGDMNSEKSKHSYSLNENYPNPFNPNTVINYSIAEPNNVKLLVHDILGREVKILVNEYQSAGLKTVNFDAGDLPSGVYFYKLTVGSFTSVKKMILMR
ncbi:MAG: T9SS type A sorting domain-containing protein, partial [Bacteroidota bacterium]|nr:T9SS type A sorting domain-containing protein [Bacteroidota bacterium]